MRLLVSNLAPIADSGLFNLAVLIDPTELSTRFPPYQRLISQPFYL